ncbi:hypothetical protein SAMN05192529_1355 [Arachidicoccus rhizosphaerae]|uniref:Uncharacterized protein n=1 Tax=Arachidicoccus rhizosphaerae TaxID=551991 RepID=A0A1H4CQR3_9BACT|nr:hypothetical protein SAMN05192529_1355 [Arachidicoccus rhizosphaerae]
MITNQSFSILIWTKKGTIIKDILYVNSGNGLCAIIVK